MGNEETTEYATVPVGQFKPNPWGFYDMAGNVSEWQRDRWQDSYEGLTSSDPVGPAMGDDRVLGGGNSWIYGAPDNLHVANRSYADPTLREEDIGFRVVRPPRS